MPIWRLKNWYGGFSTSPKRGIKGSFAFGQGLDIKSDPELLDQNYVMTKASGSNVTGLPKWIVQNGTTYYAYCSDGKIHSDASSWTSLRTVSNAGGQGLAVFNDYLWYTQDTQLGRYGLLSGSPSFTDNFQTGLTSTAAYDWAPLIVFLNKLIVAHGRTISSVDTSDTWTASHFTLPVGWTIKTLEVRGDFLYIGAFRGSSVTSEEQGALFAWDGTSTTWNSVEFINESGVNAILNHGDTLFLWAGTRGNMYQLVNGNYVKLKRIPNIGDGKVAEVYPGAVTAFNGIVHFGAAGSTDSTTLYNGVYTWGRAEKNYPDVLNYDYPISTGTTQGTTLLIGAVKSVSPTKLYVGWRDGANYGIDLISTTTKQSNTILESLIEDFDTPYRRKTFKDLKILTAPLASGDTITVKCKRDRESSWQTLGTFTFAADGAVVSKKIPMKVSGNYIKCYELQIQLTITGASIAEVDTTYDLEEGVI